MYVILEIIQNEAQEETDWKEKTEFDLINLWDKIKQPNVYNQSLGEKVGRGHRKRIK